jgi:hypothetical protein
MENFERNSDFYYLYLHYYANVNIKFVKYELAIYDAISQLLNIGEFNIQDISNKNTQLCCLTGNKIKKNYTTCCGHQIEEYAIVERIRSGITTCPICHTKLFEEKLLQQTIMDIDDIWYYCDIFDNVENMEIPDFEREVFLENYLEFLSWLN